MSDLVKSLTYEQEREPTPNVPIDELRVGDTVRTEFRIVEGSRERLQPFQGVIIKMRKKGGADAYITVRRTGVHGAGVERSFPLNSPRLEKVEVVRHGHVRRAKLYYLRERQGKKARLREKRRFAGSNQDRGQQAGADEQANGSESSGASEATDSQE